MLALKGERATFATRSSRGQAQKEKSEANKRLKKLLFSVAEFGFNSLPLHPASEGGLGEGPGKKILKKRVAKFGEFSLPLQPAPEGAPRP
ncbi:hypothetical protein D1627_12210, partial [Pontibacter oryzae]